MTKISWTASELRNYATNVESKMQNVSTNFSKIKLLLEDLKTAWTGAASNEYYNKASSLIPSLDELITAYSEQPALLRNAANTMEEAD